MTLGPHGPCRCFPGLMQQTRLANPGLRRPGRGNLHDQGMAIRGLGLTFLPIRVPLRRGPKQTFISSSPPNNFNLTSSQTNRQYRTLIHPSTQSTNSIKTNLLKQLPCSPKSSSSPSSALLQLLSPPRLRRTLPPLPQLPRQLPLSPALLFLLAPRRALASALMPALSSAA